jgi:homoserine O-acetyltransferase
MHMAILETVEQHFGPEYTPVKVGRIAHLATETPLKLDCGEEIENFPIAFQTYGELNADQSNAVLICHGLTADQYLIGSHPVTGKEGWWELMVGPGKPIDTNRFFVICSNILGGCMGSYGPRSKEGEGKTLGLNFPVITIADMVRAQAILLEELGIAQLAAIIGGSIGGMQALAWAALYPERFRSLVGIATGGSLSPQGIAFNEIGRQAIRVDDGWKDGDYVAQQSFPAKGLAVARMAAHVTYLSEAGLHGKFGRDLQEKQSISYGFDADFQIESYLRYQGRNFVNRFDPISYFYITRAMDYFDIAALAPEGKQVSDLFAPCHDKPFLLLSFSTDWLFPTASMRDLVRSFNAANIPVSFAEIESDKGHDGFLLPNEHYEAALKGFMERVEI